MKRNKACPIECKYCMITEVDSRRVMWGVKHRFGINKAITFINVLPNETIDVWQNIDFNLIKGEYVGFEGISDAFWPKLNKHLHLFLEKTREYCKYQILVTKWPLKENQIKELLPYKDKLLLVVSITGLEMLERVKTTQLLNNIQLLLKYDFKVLPFIHPYIPELNTLDYLPTLSEMGIKQVSYKGLRYDSKHMNYISLIPEKYQQLLLESNGEEILLGESIIQESLHENNLSYISFKEWIHSHKQQGVCYEEAVQSVDKLLFLANKSSSDPDGVRDIAINRRL